MTWKPWPGLNLVVVLEERSSDIQMNFHNWAFVLEWIINPNWNSVRTEVAEKSFIFIVCHLYGMTLHSVDSTFKWFVLVSSLSWTFRIKSLHHWNLRACFDCCIKSPIFVAVIQVNRLLIRSTFRILSFKQDLMVVNVNGFAWRLLTSKLACW